MTSQVQSTVEKSKIVEKRNAAIKGAFFTEFVDMFDIYLPTIILTPALSYFQPEELPQGMAGILTSLVFVTTLLGRPLGATIFGALGDKIGRRKATISSVLGFGIITLLIALLPGYSSIGITAYWLLVLLRFLDGVFLGGGYTGSHPLAMEYSEKHQRGFVGAFILSAFPLAYIVINLLGLAAFALIPQAGPDSPYAVWGWRIPFVIGALLAFWLAAYYIRKVPESETWESSKKEKNSLASMFRGKTGRSFFQVFIMMTGFWLTQNIVTLILPTTVLRTILGLDGIQVTLTLFISYAVLFGSYIAAGVIGQKIGRRRFFLILGPAIVLVGSVLLAILLNGKALPLPLIMLLVVLFSVIVTAPWGVIVTYINERFTTEVRASGFGLGFSASVVLPSFYAFYMNWLGGIMSYNSTIIALLIIGAVIGTVGAYLGPETKDVDFNHAE
ncbi:MFS transporter [Brevibacillus nitrificans]|uniref:MFS transporter n=1 Tax=Brevibacillus nitrificans TaxID=651560 RepID=UPI00285D9735|nr:MFS transporter [Brevibacillus nitrificans]MDR7315447.1 MFS family permease [Brevibacillus nitrificans]